jgi:hypothetical protein
MILRDEGIATSSYPATNSQSQNTVPNEETEEA